MRRLTRLFSSCFSGRMDISLSRQVLSMRYTGYEPEDIAAQLNLSVPRVRSIVDKAIASQADEHRIAAVREAELLKLEEMEAAFLPSASSGSAKAASTVLSIMQRRALILGTDKAPPSVAVNFNLVGLLSSLPRIELAAPLPESPLLEGVSA